jgi:hypothetical protein
MTHIDYTHRNKTHIKILLNKNNVETTKVYKNHSLFAIGSILLIGTNFSSRVQYISLAPSPSRYNITNIAPIGLISF